MSSSKEFDAIKMVCYVCLAALAMGGIAILIVILVVGGDRIMGKAVDVKEIAAPTGQMH
ncbi:MAG: hypothetical protein AAF333_07930 [Planctomycetota bacterium]